MSRKRHTTPSDLRRKLRRTDERKEHQEALTKVEEDLNEARDLRRASWEDGGRSFEVTEDQEGKLATAYEAKREVLGQIHAVEPDSQPVWRHAKHFEEGGMAR